MSDAGMVRRIVAALALVILSAIPQPQGALGQGTGQQRAENRRYPGATKAAPGQQAASPGSLAAKVRRDLFAPPPGVAVGARMPGGPGGGAVPLPPLPVPEVPGPAVAPVPIPGLPGSAQGKGATAPPVSLRGIAIGQTPQAVLASGTTFTIVTLGQDTLWGTVRSIMATGVILETSSGPRPLTFEETKGSP